MLQGLIIDSDKLRQHDRASGKKILSRCTMESQTPWPSTSAPSGI